MQNLPGKTLIIAEAGVNHNGSLDTAYRLIDAGADAGVDFVKFQTFRADRLVSATASRAKYQEENMREGELSQHQMLKALELDDDAHHKLIAHCARRNVRFLSTAFDLQSIDYLGTLGLPIFKVPSGEITNLPYLRRIAEQGKPVLLSTGMSTLGEIEAAIWVLLSSLTRDDLTVLHCNTQYPTPYADVNLRAMSAIRQAFGVQVGYSDHTLGIEVPIAAVSLGASCIEKHFTLSRDMPGPDHRASLEPKELKKMVSAIRNVEHALGNGIKQPSPSEVPNIPVARKSIHLYRELKQGETITDEDLIMLRPGTGISPMHVDTVVGCKVRITLPDRTMLRPEHIE